MFSSIKSTFQVYQCDRLEKELDKIDRKISPFANHTEQFWVKRCVFFAGHHILNARRQIQLYRSMQLSASEEITLATRSISALKRSIVYKSDPLKIIDRDICDSNKIHFLFISNPKFSFENKELIQEFYTSFVLVKKNLNIIAEHFQTIESVGFKEACLKLNEGCVGISEFLETHRSILEGYSDLAEKEYRKINEDLEGDTFEESKTIALEKAQVCSQSFN